MPSSAAACCLSGRFRIENLTRSVTSLLEPLPAHVHSGPLWNQVLPHAHYEHLKTSTYMWGVWQTARLTDKQPSIFLPLFYGETILRKVRMTHSAFSTTNEKGPTDSKDRFLNALFLRLGFWDPSLSLETFPKQRFHTKTGAAPLRALLPPRSAPRGERLSPSTSRLGRWPQASCAATWTHGPGERRPVASM